MAKKNKAIYAPGELNKVRGRLGSLDANEAKRMAEVLGGEVGVERPIKPDPQAKKEKRVRNETVNVRVGSRDRKSHGPQRRVELASDVPDEPQRTKKSEKGTDPFDNPAVPIKLSYWERVKMDKYAEQPDFEIKSSIQVMQSMISLFGDPPDFINPVFITRRLNEYYKTIELLVTSTRNVFPRNNLRRNERFKKMSPFAFAILDTIRYWNIERITTEMARLQGHPRNVKISDLSDILRAVYKPLFILELLDYEKHIKESYKLIYKVIYLENPQESKKFQEAIRASLSSFLSIRKNIRFLLYPLLLKLLSDRWIPYEDFFNARRNRIKAFLNVSDSDKIDPASAIMPKPEEILEDQKVESAEEEAEAEREEQEDEAEKAKRAAIESERKAVERGLQILDTLFPKAGMNNLATYPDLFPYFSDVFSLKKEYVLIAPTDPLQLVAILLRILEELFFGLRFVSFGTVMGSDGSPERVDNFLSPIINSWHRYKENSFEKEYLPRLSEYCRVLENKAYSRTSNYVKRILNELHWAKRLYFLPFFKFESLFPPPFQKRDISALYPVIRTLRKYLTAVAAGIELGIKKGGAEKRAPCDGINNPWEQYVFQVPNPLSTRLDALLEDKMKTNATLVFYTLAITVVLDHLVNNEDSWAYGEDRNNTLFRSADGGVTPLLGVDIKVNSDALFRQSLKNRG